MSNEQYDPDQENGINSLVRGNPADARELRANLSVFARQADSRQINHLVSDVLAGHANVREVFRTPEFDDALGRRLGNIQHGLDELSDEQRSELFDTSRERTSSDRLAEMRDAFDPGGEEPSKQPIRTEEDEDEFFENLSIFDLPQ